MSQVWGTWEVKVVFKNVSQVSLERVLGTEASGLDPIQTRGKVDKWRMWILDHFGVVAPRVRKIERAKSKSWDTRAVFDQEWNQKKM